MRVYKYMSLENFKKTVIGGRLFLKASRPSEFNDPYEGKGVIKGEPSIGFAREWVDTFSLWSIIKIPKDRVSVIKSACIGNVKGQFEWADFFDDLIRIVSFSSTTITEQIGSDLLMWSHYADSGRGIRLTLDLDENKFPLKDAIYEASRPVLDLSKVAHCDVQRDNVFADYLGKCIVTKPKAWEYESEKRLVLPVDSEHLRFMTPADEYKNKQQRNLLLELPGTSLEEIALGVKVENVSQSQEMMKLVRADGFGHVRFYRAVFEDAYAYKYVNLFNE